MDDYDDNDGDNYDDYGDDDNDTTATIKCPSCGAEVYEDSPYCPVCGDYILDAATGSRKSLLVVVIVALIIVVFVLGSFLPALF